MDIAVKSAKLIIEMTLRAPERKWREPKKKEMDSRRSQSSRFVPQATTGWL
jgi:hypothetical protein